LTALLMDYHVSYRPTSPRLRMLFFNQTPTTELYTLSLHDALPIFALTQALKHRRIAVIGAGIAGLTTALALAQRGAAVKPAIPRSEEHTSELQSRENLVCRLLLEKKKKIRQTSQLTEAHLYKAKMR